MAIRGGTGGPHPPGPALAVAIGIGAGGLSGLFGIGGGILVVPALVLFGGMGQHRAHGTSLAATAPLALAGLAGFAVDRQVDWAVAGLLVLGAATGAVLGTAALRRVREGRLRIAFAVLLLVAAARMLLSAPAGAGRADLGVEAAGGLISVGMLAGLAAGLFGIGGGIVMVPAQVLLFGIPGALAKGTSLAVIVPTAAVGTVRNLRHDLVDLRSGSMVGLAGAAASFGAARLAVRLDPGVSAVLFAGLLVVAAARLLRTGRRSATGQPSGTARARRDPPAR